MFGRYGRPIIEQRQVVEENGAGVTGLGRIAIAGGIAILLSVVSICARADDTVRFVALGDLPYTNSQAKDLEAEIKPKIQIGDFRSSFITATSRVAETIVTMMELQAAYNQIMSLLPGRVFFTPGDNDWTDCDRKKLDQPISELVRLAKLRDSFYSKPLAVANKMQATANGVSRECHVAISRRSIRDRTRCGHKQWSGRSEAG